MSGGVCEWHLSSRLMKHIEKEHMEPCATDVGENIKFRKAVL